MTRIIIESSNERDLSLIKELIQRLRIDYRIEKLAEETTPEISRKNKQIKLKKIDISNFGDPSEWQRKVRADRNLGFNR